MSEKRLIIMPCYNEQGRIGPVVKELRQRLPEADVVVINDCSVDASADEASRAGAVVLTHCCNMGYGAALETGYLYAIRGGYTGVFQMDADGQHLPCELPALESALAGSGADIVIGSRYLGAAVPTASSPVRRLGHRVFGMAIYLTCGQRLSDPTSGFRALNRRALDFLVSGVFPCDYPDSDVLLMAAKAGLRIGEVPVRMQARSGGTSMHSGLKPLYYALRMFFAMFIVLLNRRLWCRWRDAHPVRDAADTCESRLP